MTFSAVTFASFTGEKIHKIDVKAFNKTAKFIDLFDCYYCSLVHQNVSKIIYPMTNLWQLSIELNDTEIPANTIVFPYNSKSQTLNGVAIKSQQNLTIKSGAIKLKSLKGLTFYDTTIQRIEKDALNMSVDFMYEFSQCNLTGKISLYYIIDIK